MPGKGIFFLPLEAGITCSKELTFFKEGGISLCSKGEDLKSTFPSRKSACALPVVLPAEYITFCITK